MKATTILNRLLTDVTPTMHKIRRQSLKAMLTSLMSGATIMGDEFKWLTEDDCKIHPPQLSVIDSLISDVEDLSAKYNDFMTNSNLPSLFEGTIEDAFDRFSNERHQYHQSLKK
ncbi:MAG: hypothetical protein RQ732_06550 [Methylophaga sp.]|nr:hypothetical protein [Methylophaga sp.]